MHLWSAADPLQESPVPPTREARVTQGVQLEDFLIKSQMRVQLNVLFTRLGWWLHAIVKILHLP